MAGLFEKLQNESPSELEQRSFESLEWFKDNLRYVKVRPDQTLREGEVVTTLEIGRMYMYFYEAKHKNTLPYFDRFPLVIPIRKYATGFIGINLHYIAPRYRVLFLEELYEYTNNKDYDDTTRFRLTYELLKGVSRLKYYKPCLKEYLYGHIASQFSLVPSQYWEIVAMLPSQQFNVNANSVYADSRRKVV